MTEHDTAVASGSSSSRQDEWLWGWDPTPGIVSVWAEENGRVFVWRRQPGARVVCEQDRFRPWLLLQRLDDLAHLGERLRAEPDDGALINWRELDGPGALRFLVSARDLGTLTV